MSHFHVKPASGRARERQLAAAAVSRSLADHNITPNSGTDAQVDITSDGQGEYIVTVRYEVEQTFCYRADASPAQLVRPAWAGAGVITRSVAGPASRTTDSTHERRQGDRHRRKGSKPVKLEAGPKKKYIPTKWRRPHRV